MLETLKQWWQEILAAFQYLRETPGEDSEE